MKKLYFLLLGLLVLFTSTGWGQSTLLNYTFDGSGLTGATNVTSLSGVNPTMTASTAEVYFQGNPNTGMAASFITSLNKYFDLVLTTTGYTGISISFDGRSSQTGSVWTVTGDPAGGTSFSAITTLTCPNGSFGSKATTALSGSNAYDNKSSIRIRLTATGTSATIRLDNLIITGTSAAAPTVLITAQDPNTPTAVDWGKGTTGNIFYWAAVSPTVAAATFSSVKVDMSGTYAAADISASGFKLYYSADATFTPGSAPDVLLGSQSSSTGTGETITWSSLSQSIAKDGTGYIYATADIASGATTNRTIAGTFTGNSNIVFSPAATAYTGSSYGSTTTKTIIVAPTNPSTFAISCASQLGLDISLNAPTVGTVKVFANTTGTFTKPTGDGANFINASTNYSLANDYSGTVGGRLVYSGSGANFSLTGLASGTTYYLKAYSYIGSTSVWSSGTSVISAAATTQPVTLGAVTASSGQLVVNWTLPAAPACINNVIVIARQGSAVEAAISKANFDGLVSDADFTGANNDWSTKSNTNDVYDLTLGLLGTDNTNYLVYKGNGTSVTLAGLTNGTTYHFDIFTVYGSGAAAKWSAVVTGSGTPVVANVATDYFRSSVNNGVWGTASNWQYSVDNGVTPWATATLVPGTSAAGILIRNGYNINSNTGSVSADDITVENGATFTISGGTFTLNNGAAAIDLQADGIVTWSGGTFTTTGTGIAFASTGIYNHNVNGGTVPAATWHASSQVNITGMMGTAPSGINQAFGNFRWACGSQSTYLNINDDNFSVAGTLTMDNSGSSNLAIVGSTTTNHTNTINNLTINAGTLVVNYFTSTAGGFSTLIVNGNITISGASSILDFLGGAGDPVSPVDYPGYISLKGNLTVTSGSFYCSNIQTNAYGQIDFTGTSDGVTGVQSVSIATGNTSNRGVVDFYVSSGAYVKLTSAFRFYYDDYFEVEGTLNTQGNTIADGSGATLTSSFVTYSGSKFITSVSTGITASTASGAVQLTTRTYSSESDYEFQGANTGNFATITLPTAATVRNLTINNASGVNMSSSTTVTGALNLTAGVFTVPTGNTLTIAGTVPSPVGTITATAATSTVALTNNGFTLNASLFTTSGTLTNLTNDPGASNTNTLNGNFIIGGTMALTSGVLNNGNNTLTFQNGNTPISVTSGTLTMGASSNLVFGTTGNLGGSAFTIPASTFTSGPTITGLTLNRTNAITLNTQGMELTGSLTLTLGTLNIGSSLLNLNNATLSAPGGYLQGSSTSDLTIKGTHADTVVIPTSSSFSIRTFNIEGTRKVAMAATPVYDVNLYSVMTIASDATYCNGGESRIFNTVAGVTAVDIYGKFITRDKDGFYGGGTSITGAILTLRDGSTVEYGRTGDQQVTSTSIISPQVYYNIIFSGTGTKTPSNAVNVNTLGSVTITGTSSLIVDATSNNIGLTSANTTAFNMNGGIFKVGTAATLPLMDGTYNLTGGVIQYNGGSLGTNAQSIRAKTYHAIEVYGTNVGNSAAVTLNSSGGSFTIKSGGNYFMNTNSIISTSGTNTTTVVVENGGTFRTGNAAGFSGTILADNTSISSNIDVSNITLAAGSTVEYFRSTPASVSGDQVITNRLDYQNLTLSGNGVKTAPSGTLTVKGDLVKSGTSTFAHNSGLVLLSGGNQNFAGLPYNSLTVTNTSTSTKTLVGDGSITDALTLGGTNTTLAIGSNVLTLKSSSTLTARVAPLPASANITYTSSTLGKFKVERYLPMDLSGNYTSRRWRLMGLPVSTTGAPTIKEAWQEGGTGLTTTAAYPSGPDAYNPNPGYGTRITNGITAANGFDAGTTANPSIYYWDGAKWVAPTSTTSNITSATAYMLFVRGDRSVPITNQFQTTSGGANTRMNGQINIHTVDMPIVTGSNFLSNPYPSAIDMRSVGFGTSGTGVVSTPTTTYHLWDPKLLGSNNVGGWVTFNWNGSTFTYVPYTAYPGGTNGMSDFLNTKGTIESGMAFMIDNAGAPNNFVFTEPAKIASLSGNTTTGIASRPMQPLPNTTQGEFYTNLYYIEGSSGREILSDGVATTYGDIFVNTVTDEDARKVQTFSTKEKIGLLRDNNLLAIERRKTITIADTIHLQMLKLNVNYEYQFQFYGKDFAPELTAFLVDRYLKKYFPIPTNGITKHNFETDGVAGSTDVNRFIVVFREPISEGPLPVTFALINAIKNDNSVLVDWKVENEINIKQYEVERSADGINFTKVNTTNAVGTTTNNYSWLDVNATASDNFYRIKSIGKDGKVIYSKIVKVNYSDAIAGFTIYPNPTTDGQIGVSLTNAPKGQYAIRLINNLGQLLQSKNINHTGGSSLISLQTLTAKGVYHVEITKPDKTKETIKIFY